jgi:hypothetical protein
MRHGAASPRAAWTSLERARVWNSSTNSGDRWRPASVVTLRARDRDRPELLGVTSTDITLRD